ncbi:MAG: mucoidy inhibitor MuiA family protein [Planctomycetes bacterium]|nr:mucoidy inhibitor MuiA family protein [Planctomycetota bacterium]
MQTLRPLAAVALAALAALGSAQEPIELGSTLREVTVYPSSARVVRVADGLAGDGQYVLRGLPAALDPDSVRVRCVGGYVVGVEVRSRSEQRSPEARLEELRARRQELARRLVELQDEQALAEQRGVHLRALLKELGLAERREVRGGEVDAGAWKARLDFVAGGLREVQARQRELAQQLAALRDELKALDERVQARDVVEVRDVYVKVAGAAATERLELAYLVGGASWSPRYDVRATEDGRKVTLGYRGTVRQSTGEDWRDVRLLLSSAEPQRSAQAPELSQRWASLYDPREASGAVMAPAAARAPEEKSKSFEALASLGYAAGDDEDGYAAVLEEGLSVRFVVPGTDSVESGGETVVQVGEVALDVAPEYHCVPRRDTTVWLRGRATNTGRWPILPGEASVFFGDDFLGRAALETVEVDQEFTLPLGAADAVTCERVKTKDFTEGPSFFGSKAKETEGWRLVFANHGGAVHRADGSVRVVVREALPRPTDERISVELEGATLAPSRAERWQKDAEQLGIRTWELDVPLGGETELRFAIAVSFPKSSGVSYR